MKCKYCDNPPRSGGTLCEECYHNELDCLASAEEYDRHHGISAEEIHERSSWV